jgi:hypothetical protein
MGVVRGCKPLFYNHLHAGRQGSEWRGSCYETCGGLGRLFTLQTLKGRKQ